MGRITTKFYELARFRTADVLKTLSIILHIEYDKIDEFYKLAGLGQARVIIGILSIPIPNFVAPGAPAKNLLH
jgi:hypothetical protein